MVAHGDNVFPHNFEAGDSVILGSVAKMSQNTCFATLAALAILPEQV
jgi:hypothetical protein